MADLNRDLQAYLAQSKGGGGAKTISQSGSSSSMSIDMNDSDHAVPGSWFGRWSSRGGGGGSTAQSSPSGGYSWPWSAEPDPCLPGMSRRQRLVVFGVCICFSALCFGLSALYAPLLLLYARKFALLWSLGSLFAIVGAAVLRGPSKMIGFPTPGAAVYMCSLAGTLYAALSLHSTVLTALGAMVQVAVIVGYVVSLLPGGTAGIKFMGGLAASAIKRTVTGKTMPI